MRSANFVAVVRRRRATIILAVTAALVAAATAFGATAALPPYKLVLNYQAYVGGKGKAKPNLAPVKIGFINGQGGPVQFNFPQATSVVEAGVKMINAELGGVHRHPVQLSECFWAQAEEEGVRCGQQMVNDKVKTIIFGFVTIGNQSIYATVKGTIPITGVITANAADPTAKNAYFLNGSQTTGIGAFGTYTKRRFPKVKTAAVVYPTDPGAITAAAAHQEGPAAGGREGDDDRRSAARDRPDRAGDAGELVRHDRRRSRLPDVRAVRAGDRPDHYTKPILSTPICTFIPQAAYASGDIPKWTYGLVQTLVNKPGPQSKLYLKKGLQYGTTVPNMLWVFSEGAWETLLATVKIMNQIPYSKLTPARISAGFKAFRGPTILGPPNIACGKVSKAEPAACGNQTNFYNYMRQGQVEARRGLAEAARSEVDAED